MQDFTVRESVRADGLRVITKDLSGTGRVRVSVTAGVGSAFDPPGKLGLFHFFEHMAFKGTSSKTVDEIKALRGQYFLRSNAGTSCLSTTYWGDSAYTRLSVVCDLLFDMYQNPLFPEHEIPSEKEVVYNEIARNADDDDRIAARGLDEALWKDNPLRRFGGGIPGDIASITRPLLLEMHENWYVPSNTTVVGVGRVSHEALTEMAFEYFRESSRLVVVPSWDDECEDIPERRDVVIARPERKQAIILFGLKIPFLTEREEIACALLMRLLANGPSSVLYREIREKRGLVYAISGHREGVEGLGSSLVFSAKTLPERIEVVSDLMKDLILSYPLSDQDLFRRQKERFLDAVTVSPETIDEWHFSIERMMMDKKKNAQEYAASMRETEHIITALALEDVIELRGRLLQGARLVSVVVRS